MMRADSCFGAERIKSNRLFVMLIDCMTNAAHQLDLRIICLNAARMATATGAKARLFGRLGYLKETNLFPSRPARGAGRPAVNSRRAHGEDETAVPRRIACDCDRFFAERFD